MRRHGKRCEILCNGSTPLQHLKKNKSVELCGPKAKQRSAHARCMHLPNTCNRHAPRIRLRLSPALSQPSLLQPALAGLVPSRFWRTQVCSCRRSVAPGSTGAGLALVSTSVDIRKGPTTAWFKGITGCILQPKPSTSFSLCLSRGQNFLTEQSFISLLSTRSSLSSIVRL